MRRGTREGTRRKRKTAGENRPLRQCGEAPGDQPKRPVM